MKENLATISQGALSQFAAEIAGGSCPDHLPPLWDRLVGLLRANLLEGLATLGTGVIFLTCITLFFVQLAEHGW